MWFRFLVISFLKWVVVFASIAVLSHVAPTVINGWVLSVAVWIVAFILAFVFATWAFSKRLPVRKDTLLLVGIWIFIYFMGFFTYGILLSTNGIRLMVAPEILTQLAIEIVAVLFAAYSSKRRRIASVLGEGMTV